MTGKRSIIFTGGGSGGHVVPAITLMKNLKKDFDIFYIGSYSGIESKLTVGHVDKYFSISTGKLRRYISVENFIDLFKVFFGVLQSLLILLKLRSRAKVVVSMGGFVCIPVVLAAKVLGYKIIIHEQTTRVGLANKISSKLAHKVFVSFEDSLQFFPKNKVALSGYPVRDEFKKEELSYKSFNGISLESKSKPLLFITGGGNGSKLLNDKVVESLNTLKENYSIIHQVGKLEFDKVKSLKDDSYLPVEFVGDEMPDIFKSADIVISRSGAGTVAELMTLKKKSIFIPLKIAQKNEQFHNAMAANKYIGSVVIKEDDFKEKDLAVILSSFDKEVISSEDYDFKDNATEIITEEILRSY